MHLDTILNELRRRRTQIDEAIAALQGNSHAGRILQAGGTRRPQMSAAARARIGAAKKAWWAKQKGKAVGAKRKQKLTQTAKRKPMNSAARQKLSTLMKARWEEKKRKA